MVKDNLDNVSPRRFITLVGLRQAKEGFIFLHEGPSEECEGCKVFKVCMENLDPGRVYRVMSSRDKTFTCRVREEEVGVVEVEEADIEASIKRRVAFVGGVITYQPQECEDVPCPSYRKCVPYGLRKGDKCTILRIGNEVNCPIERPLVLAILQLSIRAYPS